MICINHINIISSQGALGKVSKAADKASKGVSDTVKKTTDGVSGKGGQKAGKFDTLILVTDL